MAMSPKFSISVLALDGIDMTKACIASILKNSPEGEYHLFITNNGSRDGTREYFAALAAQYPFITAIQNEKNECFIGPNVLAFEKAKEMGSTWHVLINNDIVLPPGWWGKIEAVFNQYPNAAVVGPKGTISHVNARLIGCSAETFCYCEGSLFATRVSHISTQGPLFSSYLRDIYGDDLDCCLRMQRAGFTIHQADFHIQHRNGSTCTRHPDAIRRCRDANIYNNRVLLKKWAHWNKVRCFNFQIVVKRTFASGDILLATPIVRALKELWPLCPIDVQCGVPDIFKGNPHVRKAAKLITPDRNALVINLDMAYERKPHQHILESYAEVAGQASGLDIDNIQQKCEIYFRPEDAKTLPEGTWVAVHVGPTTWPGKNWPMDRWREVIQAIRADGRRVVLFGDKSREDFGLIDCDMRGLGNVQELAALLAQCSLFVGLDSFPMHVAQAVGVPVVALFGVTNPACIMTKGSEAIVCRSSAQHVNTGRRNKVPNITFLQTDDGVMRTITVGQVLAAVAEMTATKVIA